MATRDPIVGLTFGKWTILADDEPWKRGVQRKVLARCECGIEKRIFAHIVKNGGTTSCKACRYRARRISDEERVARDTLQSARARCDRKTDGSYARYGGRGIQVASEFRGKGAAKRLLAHIGPRPSPAFSLDRIDRNGHYAYNNVRWATRVQQARNMDRTTPAVRALPEGETLQAIAERAGVTHQRISQRAQTWAPGRPLDEPTRKKWMAYGRTSRQTKPSQAWLARQKKST